MQRFVAAVLLAIVSLSGSADGICCGDGCTRAAQHATTSHGRHAPSDGACGFCQGALTPPAQARIISRVVVEAVPTHAPRIPTDDSLSAVEHPPRR